MMMLSGIILVLLGLQGTSSFKPILINGWAIENGRSTGHSHMAMVSSSSDTIKNDLLSVFQTTSDPVLACPLSVEPLYRSMRYYGSPLTTLRCSKFETAYTSNGVYTDLVPLQPGESGLSFPRSLQELVQTDLFRTPWVTFAYERGWRDGFKNAGFPGVDKEFEMVMEFFEPIRAAQGTTTIMDISCGSGLMTRRLVRSKGFERVIAGDFSETMLFETRRRFLEEALPVPELLRVDVAQLPLQSSSVDGFHAGAALHCWPRLEQGLAEIYRALKPEGRFFATTFKKGAYGVPQQVNSQGGPSFRFFEITELEMLLRAAGFSDVTVALEGSGCLIATCIK